MGRGAAGIAAAARHASFIGDPGPATFEAAPMFGATLLAPENLGEALQRVDFLGQLDALRRTAGAPAAYEQQVVGASAATSLGLSAGYVMWLLRGGALMSSLIASLPAWHLLDPLPVLRNAGDGEDDDYSGDDEVESVFGGAASAPEPPAAAPATAPDNPDVRATSGSLP